MNNTLTGLGLALVLALLAALVGPWFVNWTAYRDDFARQASALVGAPVTVSGGVDARLLPTPYVRFRGLSSGAGPARLTIDEVEIELAIAPLLRGEFKAERVKLVRPRLGLDVAADGGVRSAFSAGPRGAADRVSFDRAEIIDGEATLHGPWGASSLVAISGVAEAGSLSQGPYKFEGAASANGRRLDLRLSTARADASGGLRLKLSASEAGRRTAFDAEGLLKVSARPAFEGRATLSQAPQSDRTFEPWSASGGVKLQNGTLRVDGLELVYGAEERAARLSGSGGLSFAGGQRAELRLQTRQIDLDRLLGDSRPRSPAGVLNEMASRLPAGLTPPADGVFSLEARGVVLAGDVARDIKLDIEAEKGLWRVRRASATLPGEARVSASGALALSGGAPGFAGPVEFDAADLSGFRRWLSGGRETGATLVRRLSLKGEVTARASAATIERAELAADGARSTGHLAWEDGGDGRPRLQAALVSERLDLDALGLDAMLAHALSERGADVFLALDAKTLSGWGLTMRDVSIDGALDANGVDLKRLEARDAGGASISGSGRLAASSGGPTGALTFKIAGDAVQPALAVGRALGAPQPALDAMSARAGALDPVDLQVDLEASDEGRRLAVQGAAAGGRIDARLSGAELSLDAPAELDLTIRSEDGRRLASLVGLSVSPVGDAEGGEIALKLSGAPARGMSGEGRFAALSLVATGRGDVAAAPVAGLSAQGEATLETGDIGALLTALGRGSPLSGAATPLRLTAKAALGPEGLRLDDIAGAVAGSAVGGSASVPADAAKPIEGRLSFDDLSAASLAGLALSPEALVPPGDGSFWPKARFGPSPTRGLSGRFDVAAKRLALTPGQVASDAAFTLALKRDSVAVEGLSATLDSGRLTGAATVVRSGPEAAISLQLRLRQAAAERLLGLAPEASPLRGATDVTLETQGSGRSLADVAASLTGAGAIELTDAAIRRLDPKAIDRIEPQVEAGLALDAPKVAAALSQELDTSDLRLGRAAASFTASGGVIRTGAFDVRSEGLKIGGVASVDLRTMRLDADLTLQPERPDAPQIGASFEGPLAAPARRIDATAFTGWLSLRAVERETKRIEALEADARERARLARERQEEERRRAEAEKARLEGERRKAEAERRKREAETGALIDALPRPAGPALPKALDLSPVEESARQRPAPPPAGVFSPQTQQQPRGAERGRASTSEAPLPAPQSILPPAAAAPR